MYNFCPESDFLGGMAERLLPDLGQEIHKIRKGYHMVPRKKNLHGIVSKTHRGQHEESPQAQSGTI